MRILASALFAGVLVFSLHAEEVVKDQKPLMVERGKLIFSEEFNQPLAKGWMDGKGKWEIVDGVLRGAELAEDKHGAVKRNPVKFHDAVVQFSFKLDGAKRISLSLNAEKGHVCRAVIQPTGFSVNKDKSKKDATDLGAVLDTVTTTIDPGKWYTLTVEMAGKEMLAQLDGKQIAFGSHDGLDVNKANFGFTVSGSSASFKDLKIWEAQPSAAWPAIKAKLSQAKK